MRTIDEISGLLAGIVPEAWIGRDLWCLNHDFFGPYLRTGSEGSRALYLGGSSGLFPLLMAKERPDVWVEVYEPNTLILEAIEKATKALNLSNVRMLSTLDPILKGSDPPLELGHLVIEKAHFGLDVLKALEGKIQVDVLLGVFDESMANPLWLHRWSRRMARRFHWHNETLERPMVGTAFEGPDVSVIVPAYGVENYLDQCLSSLCDQTLSDLEILVVDDGAKDRSGVIADEWAARDPRVRVIHQANAGCAAARSNGLKEARGFWVGLVDGDDWVDPSMFEALAESSVRFTSDIAQCGYRHCFDSDGSWLDEVEYPVLDVAAGSVSGLIQNPKDLIPLRPTIWRRIYRRDFLKDHGIDFPKHIRRFDDLPFHFMTLALAERLSVVGGCYYHYRQQRPGQDINIRDERLHVHFPIFSLLKDFVRSHCSAELEAHLFKTQVASHAWALSVLEPLLTQSYRRAVKYDLFGEPLVMNEREKLKAAKSLGRSRAALAKRIRRQFGSGRNEWLKVRDFDR